jgi:NTP pyrophosphatase (non-canonical NTP hydrolase)
LDFKELQKEIHQCAVDHGWWSNGNRNIPECLCLIHSEVSEALEDYRTGNMNASTDFVTTKPIGFPSELADIIIRTMDLAEALGIDLEEAVRIKKEYNKIRPYRHGGKLA